MGGRQVASRSVGPARTLAGLSLPELRRRYRAELFQAYLPFWDHYGIDHQYGGFMCSLDHDGTLVNDSKFHWFQGRGIWVYSFLYNHFDKNPQYLETACKDQGLHAGAFPPG